MYSKDTMRTITALAVGFFAGAAAGALLYAVLNEAGPRTEQADADTLMRRGQRPPSEKAGYSFVSKRDSAESGGSASLIPGTDFNRSGGAPGPDSQGERLTMPGRPGQSLDHGDSSQTVRSARRTPEVNRPK